MNSVLSRAVRLLITFVLVLATAGVIFHASESFADLDHRGHCEICAVSSSFDRVAAAAAVALPAILLVFTTTASGIRFQFFNSFSIRRIFFGVDPPAFSCAA